ncbi:MAG: NUDIX hydrolase N-terminal domain-containing protein [Candidatus Hodarchaeota archaeon]
MTKEEKEKINLRTKQLKRWANSLYYIAKEGLDYARNDYDIKRYEEIKEISESLYKIWNRDKKTNQCSISLKQLNYFIFRLTEITDLGIKYASSDYDSERYIDSTMILMDMEVVRENYNNISKINTRKEIKTEATEVKISREPLTHFLKDEELPDAIMKMIINTKEKLWICSPWIDDILDLKKQLVNLKDKNIEILILTRKAKADSNHHKILRGLKKERFLIETNPYLHTKLIISDKIKMYLGSANLVDRSMTVLHETGIITEDQHLIKPAINYFNQLYDDAGEQGIIT